MKRRYIELPEGARRAWPRTTLFQFQLSRWALGQPFALRGDTAACGPLLVTADRIIHREYGLVTAYREGRTVVPLESAWGGTSLSRPALLLATNKLARALADPPPRTIYSKFWDSQTSTLKKELVTDDNPTWDPLVPDNPFVNESDIWKPAPLELFLGGVTPDGPLPTPAVVDRCTRASADRISRIPVYLRWRPSSGGGGERMGLGYDADWQLHSVTGSAGALKRLREFYGLPPLPQLPSPVEGCDLDAFNNLRQLARQAG